MSGLIVPQFPSGLTNEELADLVAKLAKEVDWFANGNISDQNISIIAGYRASATELKHKSGIVGMSGYDAANPLAVRFWAGHVNKNLAPFRVLQNGQIYATDAFITGLITGSTIIGGVIKTAETGERIEISTNQLKMYNSADQLNGIFIGDFSGVPGMNFGDIGFYNLGVQTAVIQQIVSGLIIKAIGGHTLFLGDISGQTEGRGTWEFSGDVTFDNDVSGKISEAYSADHATTASSADDLSPSGEISWSQVLKGGSDIADLDTKNLSSLTQNSSNRTVTDTEKSTWNAKAGTALPSWTASTLTNSWVNYGSPYADAGYYKDDLSIVHLRGIVKSGTIAAGSFTLPAGFRPGKELVFPIVSNSAFGVVNVRTNGEVICGLGSNVSVVFDGISFRAEL